MKVFFLLHLIVLPLSVQAQDNCRTILDPTPSNSAAAKAPEEFDPSALLLNHSLDPNKIKFEFWKRPEMEWTLELRVLYDSEPILDMVFYSVHRESTIITRTDSVDRRFQGKGVGSLAYLAAALYVYDTYGMTLGSDSTDFDNVSSEAEKVWLRFMRQKIVRVSMNHEFIQYAFKAEALSKPHFNKMRKFLSTRIKPVKSFSKDSKQSP